MVVLTVSGNAPGKVLKTIGVSWPDIDVGYGHRISKKTKDIRLHWPASKIPNTSRPFRTPMHQHLDPACRALMITTACA